MVESVDTKDLKSFGYCSCAGSSPASSTGVLCFVLKIKGLEKTDCKKVRQKSAKGFLKQKRPPISLDKQPFVCIKTVLAITNTKVINFAEVAQLVEHNLAKVRVAGSSPVFRSCFQIKPRNSSELRGFYIKDICQLDKQP